MIVNVEKIIVFWWSHAEIVIQSSSIIRNRRMSLQKVLHLRLGRLDVNWHFGGHILDRSLQGMGSLALLELCKVTTQQFCSACSFPFLFWFCWIGLVRFVSRIDYGNPLARSTLREIGGFGRLVCLVCLVYLLCLIWAKLIYNAASLQYLKARRQDVHSDFGWLILKAWFEWCC